MVPLNMKFKVEEMSCYRNYVNNEKHGDWVEEDPSEEEYEMYFKEEPSVNNYADEEEDPEYCYSEEIEQEVCAEKKSPIRDLVIENEDEEEDPQYNLSEQDENSVEQPLIFVRLIDTAGDESDEEEDPQYCVSEEDKNSDGELSICECVNEEEDPQYYVNEQENSKEGDAKYYFDEQNKNSDEEPLICERLDDIGYDTDEEEDPQYCISEQDGNSEDIVPDIKRRRVM